MPRPFELGWKPTDTQAEGRDLFKAAQDVLFDLHDWMRAHNLEEWRRVYNMRVELNSQLLSMAMNSLQPKEVEDNGVEIEL